MILKKIFHKGSIYSFLFVLALQGCKQSEIPYYNNQHDAVRFAWKEENNKEEKGLDSDRGLFQASYSFVATPSAESHNYELPIELIGKISDKERKVSYEIDTKATTAPEGSYEILGGAIPAGKRSGKLIVKLKNSDLLKVNEYKLYINLIKSSDLAAGPLVATRAELLWTRRILPPSHADHIATYNALIKGDPQWNSKENEYFSSKALEVIVDALSWTDWDDLKKHGNNGNGVRYGNYKYLPRIGALITGDLHQGYAQALASYIKKYNANNPSNPLKHDGGKLNGQLIEARSY